MKAKFAFSKKKLPAAIKIERLRKWQNFICKAKDIPSLSPAHTDCHLETNLFYKTA